MLTKVDEFIFSVNFIILEIEYVNPQGHIHMILGRPFLTTFNALINYHSGLLKLTFENMAIDLNIFYLETCFKSRLIRPRYRPISPFLPAADTIWENRSPYRLQQKTADI